MKRSSSSAKAASPAKAAWFEGAFDTFADPADGQIGPEGIEKLCAALGVEPTDVLVLVLAWQVGASQMGYFTREEWKSGADMLAVATSPESLLERLSQIYTATRRNGPKCAAHLHTQILPRGAQKNIDVGAAVAMLPLLQATPSRTTSPTSASSCRVTRRRRSAASRAMSGR